MEISLGYPGGSNVVTRALTSRRGSQKRERWSGKEAEERAEG